MTWRFLPWDFETRSRTIARYGRGALAPDCTSQDWGITYDELEPHYDRFERVYGVGGKAGNLNGTLVPGGNRFDAVLRQRDGSSRRIEGIELPMPGRHNVQNALAAVAVAAEMGCSDECIRTGFGKFAGVKRRFTKVGEIDDVSIIDDYGHHPVEIRAVLAAAREGVKGRVIAVVQPHRFTRLRDHMDDFQGAFNDADVVYAAPVYAAGEQPIDGVDSAAMVAGMKARGHRSAQTIAGPEALADTLAQTIQPGDMVVCLGAGDITKWAAGLADAIQARRAKAG